MKFINNPRELYIYGSGEVAEIISSYVTAKGIKIKAFVDNNPSRSEINELPVIDIKDFNFDQLKNRIPFFVAIGYKKLNDNRAQKIQFLLDKNCLLANLIFSENDLVFEAIDGLNIFVAANVSCQPFAKIKSGVMIWDNCVVGHHCIINNFCWLTSGTVIGGHSKISNNCFFGINSSVSHMLEINQYSFIGAGCLVSNDLKEKSVIFKSGSKVAPFDSSFFVRSGMLK